VLPEINRSQPHPARIYDYFIGGENNFAADRETAAQILQRSPAVPVAARENRAFLGRAVRYLTAEAGITQFLDIGSGLPATNNVHQVAQDIAPSARVVYADNDPLVHAHAQALLASAPAGRTAYLHGDLLDALPPGSYLVASHLTTQHDPAATSAGQQTMREAGMTMQKRDSDVFAELAFSGLDLVPPGVVLASEWRPAGDGPRPAPAEVNCYAGVARKP
jgi:S-adenosyl methyltransferase